MDLHHYMPLLHELRLRTRRTASSSTTTTTPLKLSAEKNEDLPLTLSSVSRRVVARSGIGCNLIRLPGATPTTHNCSWASSHCCASTNTSTADINSIIPNHHVPIKLLLRRRRRRRQPPQRTLVPGFPAATFVLTLAGAARARRDCRKQFQIRHSPCRLICSPGGRSSPLQNSRRIIVAADRREQPHRHSRHPRRRRRAQQQSAAHDVARRLLLASHPLLQPHLLLLPPPLHQFPRRDEAVAVSAATPTSSFQRLPTPLQVINDQLYSPP